MVGKEDEYSVRYSDFKMIQRDIDELRKDYFGNGKEGTKMEVARMKNDFENHKKFIISKLNTNNIMTSLVLVALIANVVKSFF